MPVEAWGPFSAPIKQERTGYTRSVAAFLRAPADWPHLLWRPRCRVQSRLRPGVLDVFLGSLLCVLGFRLGIRLGLQRLNGFREAQSLSTFGSAAGGRIAAPRLNPGDVPLQTVEPNFKVVADVQRGDTLAQLPESRAAILPLRARRQQRLQLRRQLFAQL